MDGSSLKESNGSRSPTNIGTLLTVLVGFAAIWGAMHFQLENIRDVVRLGLQGADDNIKDNERKLSEHMNSPAHMGTIERMTALEMKLLEVETQFRWMSDVVNLSHQELGKGQAILWKKVMAEELPVRDYWPFSFSDKK